MSRYKKGEIVLVPFPFSDKLEEKTRPTVIVSNRIRRNTIIVAFVTSKKRSQKDDDVIYLDKKDKGFDKTRLKESSSIYLSQLATINTKKILGRLGFLNKENTEKINGKIKNIFGL
jgi:mRNA interferase MazF